MYIIANTMGMKSYDKEFLKIINDIITHNEFLKLKKFRHHINSNVYDHSIKVADMCYKHFKQFKMSGDVRELLRGALLHDYYLYDWRDKSPETRLHGFRHPKRALKNALRDYPNLSKREIDMIRHHMFPLTISPPKTSFGWIVCFYDKIAAISDYFSKGKKNMD